MADHDQPRSDEEEDGAAESGGEEEEFELDDSSLSGQLATFLRTSGFDEKLFNFLSSEASELEIAPEGEEQALEVYDAYMKFTKLFDGEFSEFMEKVGCSSMDEMHERLSTEDQSDERASRFFQGLLAGMEYSSFVTLVRNFQEAEDDDDVDSDGDCDDDDDADQAEDTSVTA